MARIKVHHEKNLVPYGHNTIALALVEIVGMNDGDDDSDERGEFVLLSSGHTGSGQVSHKATIVTPPAKDD